MPSLLNTPLARLPHASGRIPLTELQRALEKDFDRAVELDPKLAKAWLGRGNLRSELGDPGGLEDIDRAIELDPNLTMAYYYRGASRRKAGDGAGALSDFNRALGGKLPFEARMLAHLMRGSLHAREGRREAAAADLERARSAAETLPPRDGRRVVVEDGIREVQKLLKR